MTKTKQLIEAIVGFLNKNITTFHPVYSINVDYVADFRGSYYLISVEIKEYSDFGFMGKFKTGDLKDMMEQIEYKLNNSSTSELFD